MKNFKDKIWLLGETPGSHHNVECYKKGIISDESLDAAVKRVLETQEKTLRLAQDAEITQDDLEKLHAINTECIYARADADVSLALDKNAKHYFIVMTDNDWRDGGGADVATFFGNWYRPAAIREKLRELFPNSDVVMMPQYPSGSLNCKLMTDSVAYDDIVFITYQEVQAYIGKECLTSRVLGMAECFQKTGRIAAVVHFGNPYVLEDMPHVPRVIIGASDSECVLASMEVLAGEREAKGKLVYDVNFQ